MIKDCDGYEIHEYQIIRAPFYNDIDFDKETNIDSRQYCVVQSENGHFYLISVYDWYSNDIIKKYENKNEIDIIVKDIEESENYEIARNCDCDVIYYDLDRKKLKEQLEQILENRKQLIKNGYKRRKI